MDAVFVYSKSRISPIAVLQVFQPQVFSSREDAVAAMLRDYDELTDPMICFDSDTDGKEVANVTTKDDEFYEMRITECVIHNKTK